MSENPSRSTIRVLVVGDHPRLCKAIKVGLRRFFEIEFVESSTSADWTEYLDLVIVIALSDTGVWQEGPPQTLHCGTTEQTPCLMIAEADQAETLDSESFSLLSFPFTYNDLRDKVVDALSGAPQTVRR